MVVVAAVVRVVVVVVVLVVLVVVGVVVVVVVVVVVLLVLLLLLWVVTSAAQALVVVPGRMRSLFARESCMTLRLCSFKNPKPLWRPQEFAERGGSRSVLLEWVEGNDWGLPAGLLVIGA